MIQVDARLHLSQPEILLRNPLSGKILMRWAGPTIHKWLEQGDLCYDDLLQQDYNWLELLQSTR